MLDINVHSAGGRVVVNAAGELDLESAPDLWERLAGAFEGAGEVRVQLSEVTYIDSSGVATLVQGLKRAKKGGVDYALIDPSDRVRAVLELAKLDRVFAIEDSGKT